MDRTNAATERAVGPNRRENDLAAMVQELLGDLTQLPSFEETPELYTDWGEEGEFKVQVGRGECAQ